MFLMLTAQMDEPPYAISLLKQLLTFSDFLYAKLILRDHLSLLFSPLRSS